MNLPKTENNLKKEVTYVLIDGAVATAEDAIKTGNKAKLVFRNLAFLLWTASLIVLVQLILDLIQNSSGWVMAVVIEGVLIGFGVVFFLVFKNLDPEKYGLSILNFRHNAMKINPKDAPVYNEIKADIILELYLKLGNLLFIDTANKRCQYRSRTKLSPIFSLTDLVTFDAMEDGIPILEESDSSRKENLKPHQYSVRFMVDGTEKNVVEIECKGKETALNCIKEISLAKFK
jgi:hypothetical protein